MLYPFFYFGHYVHVRYTKLIVKFYMVAHASIYVACYYWLIKSMYFGVGCLYISHILLLLVDGEIKGVRKVRMS